MLEDLFSGPKLLIIVFLFVLLFGAKKIPEIAQGIGKGMREFRKATRDISDPGNDEAAPPTAAVQESATIPCFYCSKEVARDARFCPSCGRSLEPVVCSHCKTANPLGNKFCSDCGEKLQQA
jgi:sec-independent protein translocase protein TatA